MNHRRPRTALRSSALPSLAALLASGVIVDGCDSPSDATARRERLSTHGDNAADAFHGSRVSDALREIGIGLGLITATPSDIGPAGAAPPVNPLPPIQPSGAVAPVQPTPPVQERVAHPLGGPMRIAPRPPPPPVVHRPPPEVRVARPGGMPMVHPQPPPPVETPPSRR